MRRCLVQSVSPVKATPTWSRRSYLVKEPVKTAAVIANNQSWYFLDGGAAGVPLVLANNTGTRVPSEVYTTVDSVVRGDLGA